MKRITAEENAVSENSAKIMEPKANTDKIVNIAGKTADTLNSDGLS